MLAQLARHQDTHSKEDLDVIAEDHVEDVSNELGLKNVSLYFKAPPKTALLTYSE